MKEERGASEGGGVSGGQVRSNGGAGETPSTYLPACLPETNTNVPLYYSRQQLIVGVAMTTDPSIFKAVPLINSCSAVA